MEADRVRAISAGVLEAVVVFLSSVGWPVAALRLASWWGWEAWGDDAHPLEASSGATLVAIGVIAFCGPYVAAYAIARLARSRSWAMARFTAVGLMTALIGAAALAIA